MYMLLALASCFISHATPPSSTDLTSYGESITKEQSIKNASENLLEQKIEQIFNDSEVKQLIEVCKTPDLPQNKPIELYRHLCFLIAAASFNLSCSQTKIIHVHFNQIKKLFKKTIEHILDTHLNTHKSLLLEMVHGSNFYNPFYQFIAELKLLNTDKIMCIEY